MTADNYAEYAYYSGQIIFCSYAVKRGEGFIAFDFVSGGGENATILGMQLTHPVREEIHDRHRETFNGQESN